MGGRILVLVLVLAACVPAIGFSLSMSLGGALSTVSELLAPSGAGRVDSRAMQVAEAASLVATAGSLLFAWAALLVMAVAWIRERRLGRGWPVAGTAAALAGLVLLSVNTGPMMLVMGPLWAAPGIAFAVVLCVFHAGRPAILPQDHPEDLAAHAMDRQAVQDGPGSLRRSGPRLVWGVVVIVALASLAALVFGIP